MASTILVVDDEPTQRRLIQYVVEEKLGYRVAVASGGQEAIDYILSGQEPRPDLVLLDLFMPKANGLDVIRAIRPSQPLLPVIVLTMHGDLEKAVQAVKAGAQDFLAKPVAIERLAVSLENTLRLSLLNEEVARLKRNVEGATSFTDIIGSSSAVRAAVTLAQRAAMSSIPVLIEGASGTGKELFARAIHGGSDRAGKPFVAINCGAIPENLVESILFGHEKGSFTGAVYRSLGKFREADGGTLFLDEIGDLKPDLQVKLLRALQEGEIEPVGARTPVKVDVRIISATHGDLAEKVRDGEFREDLYYRLHVFPITVPSLAERRDDIPVLAEHFFRRFAAIEHKYITGISAEAMEFLKHAPWPGNVRQLENAIFRAAVMCDGGTLELAHFRHLLINPIRKLDGEEEPLHSKAPGDMGHRGIIAAFDQAGNVRRLGDIEIEMIDLALQHYDGHMSEAARRLGIGRSTLYRKIGELGLSVPRSAPEEGEQDPWVTNG